MVKVFLGYINKPWRRGNMGSETGPFCLLVMCCICCCLLPGSCVAASNDTEFVPDNDTCPISNFTLGPAHRQELPRELLQQLTKDNRTQIIFDVKACRDAEVILYGVDFTSPGPLRAEVINISLGVGSQNSSLERCESSKECTVVNSDKNPLNCLNFTTFGIRWERGMVEVFKKVEEGAVADPENGTGEGWQPFLKSQSTVRMQGVFGTYKLAKEGDDGNSNTSEWRFWVPCTDTDQKPADTSSMVTHGHLAGAVVGALLAGILIGVVCVMYGPKLVSYIRQTLLAGWGNRDKNSRAGDAKTEEELSTLVVEENQSSASPKPQQQKESAAPRPAAGSKEPPGIKVDLALPGDNPPPLPTSSSTTSAPASGIKSKPRKASNAYTPYHEMAGSPTTPPAGKADKATPAKPNTKKVAEKTPKTSGTRKESKAGRAKTSPLPALPGDDVDTAAAAAAASSSSAAPDDVYVNADTHIYEGMRHDAPIYENRNTGLYEPLQPGAKDT